MISSQGFMGSYAININHSMILTAAGVCYLCYRPLGRLKGCMVASEGLELRILVVNDPWFNFRNIVKRYPGCRVKLNTPAFPE